VSFPATVVVREVGPRDGLQVEAPIPPVERARLIRSLVDAGIVNIEAVSFVSARAVPAMACPEEVLTALDLPAGVTVSALVPNVRGAESALSAGVDQLNVTISVSETYNERNVRMTTQQSLREVEWICALASDDGVPVDAVVSCSFGSPYEGEIPASHVKAICDLLRSAGVTAVTLADTTGMATPTVLLEVLEQTGTDVGLHLHDTRGMALVNVYAALEAGVGRFDSAIGGLGGSPFAEGAGGNVATEEVVALLDDLQIRTGIEVARLIAASRLAGELVGHPVPSRLARAGPREKGPGS
jgi:hydroxymethylglutaryl-CoA lyase